MNGEISSTNNNTVPTAALGEANSIAITTLQANNNYPIAQASDSVSISTETKVTKDAQAAEKKEAEKPWWHWQNLLKQAGFTGTNIAVPILATAALTALGVTGLPLLLGGLAAGGITSMAISLFQQQMNNGKSDFGLASIEGLFGMIPGFGAGKSLAGNLIKETGNKLWKETSKILLGEAFEGSILGSLQSTTTSIYQQLKEGSLNTWKTVQDTLGGFVGGFIGGGVLGGGTKLASTHWKEIETLVAHSHKKQLEKRYSKQNEVEITTVINRATATKSSEEVKQFLQKSNGNKIVFLIPGISQSVDLVKCLPNWLNDLGSRILKSSTSNPPSAFDLGKKQYDMPTYFENTIEAIRSKMNISNVDVLVVRNATEADVKGVVQNGDPNTFLVIMGHGNIKKVQMTDAVVDGSALQTQNKIKALIQHTCAQGDVPVEEGFGSTFATTVFGWTRLMSPWEYYTDPLNYRSGKQI